MIYAEQINGAFSYSFAFGKFNKDELCLENDMYLLILKGVILNKQELLDEKKQTNWGELVQYMYLENPFGFFKKFKGSFSGLVYDKNSKKIKCYTNHFGDQKLFYSVSENFFMVSSDFNVIHEHLLQKKGCLHLDRNAAYALLSYGYQLDGSTLIEEIKRVQAGTCIEYDGKQIRENQYYTFSNRAEESMSENEAVENLDNLFKHAVKLEFEKDKEYGFRSIASMSGGLDSRMVNWVAKDLGYEELTNLTFSQYPYLDASIAQQISEHLNYNWLFNALNPGNYLKNIDQSIRITNGLTPYHLSAHSYSSIELVDFRSFGLMHTGQLGDVVLGSYCQKNAYDPADVYSLKGSSKKLAGKVILSENTQNTREEFILKKRGFNGILTGNFTMQTKTEVASPFLDPDFFDFCMKIPHAYRAFHRLYFKWMKEKYPESAKFPWERINAKINSPHIYFNNKRIGIRQIPGMLISKLGMQGFFEKDNSFNMNPFEHWYSTNASLHNYIEQYFLENKDIVADEELKRDAQFLFTEGTVSEKLQVLTLLSFLKNYRLI